MAKLRPTSRRTEEERLLVSGRSQLQSMKRKRQRESGIVFRVGENATELEYPRDFPTLPAKAGWTYDPLSKKDVKRAIDEWVNTELHLEKVLFLSGPAGCAKTPAARALAKRLAIGHKV